MAPSLRLGAPSIFLSTCASHLSSAPLTIQRPADLSAILCSDIVLLNSKRKLLSAPMNIRRAGHTALSLTTLRPKVGIPNFVSGPREYIMEGEYVILVMCSWFRIS